jgi:hypothetical protein
MTKIFIGTFPSGYGHTAIPEGAVEAAVKAANAALDLEQEQQRRQGDTAGRFAEAGEHQTRAHDAPLQARPGGARVKDETMTDVSTRPAARPIGIDRVFASTTCRPFRWPTKTPLRSYK